MSTVTVEKLTTPSAVDYTFGIGNVIVLGKNRYLVTKLNAKSYVVATEEGGLGKIGRQAGDDTRLPIEAEKDFAWLGRLGADRLSKGQLIVITDNSQWAGTRGRIERVNATTYTVSLDGEEDGFRFSHHFVRAI